jgi:transcriptional regulator with XRE-family HTH domain
MISAEAPTLAMLRLANRLTSLELARRLGVAVTAITAWEAGRAYPSPRQQHALCQVLHVTRPALFLALAAIPVADPDPPAADGERHDRRRSTGGGAPRGRRRRMDR